VIRLRITESLAFLLIPLMSGIPFADERNDTFKRGGIVLVMPGEKRSKPAAEPG
jgi:hypothetical protein